MSVGNTGLYQDITKEEIGLACTTVGDVGQLVVHNFDGTVGIKQSPSGTDLVAGVLLTKVVSNRGVPGNVDTIQNVGRDGDYTGTLLASTPFPKNFNSNETHISGVVRLATIGTIETTHVSAGDTFGPGSGVYLGGNGKFTTNSTTAPRLGVALSSADSDGVVRIQFNLV